MLPFFKPKKGFQLAGSGGGGSIDTSALANKTDLTAIILTGTTNTSGSTISAGTWFYLNGKPCIAKVDIASGATFTKDTNYEEKTIGEELTELNSNITVNSYNVSSLNENVIITGSNHIRQFGKILAINITFTVSSTLNAWSVICKLPFSTRNFICILLDRSNSKLAMNGGNFVIVQNDSNNNIVLGPVQLPAGTYEIRVIAMM